MLSTILHKVVSVLILRQEEVVVESTGLEIQEFVRDVVKDLVFLLEFLELFIEFEKLEGMYLILLVMFVFATLITGKFPLGPRLDDFGIVACFPLANGHAEEFLSRQLIDFVMGKEVQVDIAAFAQLISRIVDLFMKEDCAVIDLFLKEALFIFSLEGIALYIPYTFVLYVFVAPIFQDFPVVELRVVLGFTFCLLLIEVVNFLKHFVADLILQF